jgi:peroxiredoxin
VARHSRSQRLEIGAIIPAREVTTVLGQSVRLPAPDRLTHIQFRRFAGCPVCDLHLHMFAQQHAQIEAAGLNEIVLFHSSADALSPYTAELPFAVIPDPDRRLYREFGVETGKRALLDPRAWGPIVLSITRSLWAAIRAGRLLPPPDVASGRLGLPADFLIAPDGRILARKYGDHAYDQWSVDELLEHARRARAHESAMVGSEPARL